MVASDGCECLRGPKPPSTRQRGCAVYPVAAECRWLVVPSTDRVVACADDEPSPYFLSSSGHGAPKAPRCFSSP